jgi:hypothetical protein
MDNFTFYIVIKGDLVVRVSGYRSGGPGFDFRPYQIFCEVRDLELGSTQPLEDNLRSYLNEKVAAPV